MKVHKSEDEGGCGVVGFASTIPVRGKHIFEPSVQMHNRGNGKGGGIAAVGLSHEDLGVTKSILEEDYLGLRYFMWVSGSQIIQNQKKKAD